MGLPGFRNETENTEFLAEFISCIFVATSRITEFYSMSLANFVMVGCGRVVEGLTLCESEILTGESLENEGPHRTLQMVAPFSLLYNSVLPRSTVTYLHKEHIVHLWTSLCLLIESPR